MKNWTKVGILGALAVSAFMACKKEKEMEGPSIAIPSGVGAIERDTTIVPAGQPYQVKLSFIFSKGSKKDDADLKDFSFVANTGGADQTVFANRPIPSGNRWDTQFTIQAAAGTRYYYRVSVRDKNDKVASRTFVFIFRQQVGGTQGRMFSGTVNLSSSNNFVAVTGASGNPIQAVSVSGLSSVAAKDVILAFFVRGSTPKTYTLITPDSLGKGSYTDPSINWTASPKPQTRFYNISQSQFDGANDSTGVYNTVNTATDLVKYPGNGDGARATIHTDDSNAPGATGPHQYLAFRQSFGSTRIWGLIKRSSAGSGQAQLEIKAIILPN